MCQQIESLLRTEHQPGDLCRRTVSFALIGFLLACTTATAQESARTRGPYVAADRGLGLNDAVPMAGSSASDRPRTFTVLNAKADAENHAPAGAVDVEVRQYDVRSADWNETTDGSIALDSADTTGAPSVLQVAGEFDLLEGLTPASGDGALGDDEQSAVGDAARTTDFSGSGPEERMPGLAWPGSDARIDPEQTLRDWAENAGLLVGFGVISLWLVRQWLRQRTSEGAPTTHLRTIESLSLPQRCRVHLVEVQGRQVIVATDAAGVKSVTVLPDRFAALMDDSEGEAAATAAVTPDADRSETERSGGWSSLRESRLA